MLASSVIPLSEHYLHLQERGTPNFLQREMERCFDREAVLDDALTADLLDFLSRRLPPELRSPLVRSPARQAAVEQAVREWLEREEHVHPEKGLAATPQMVRRLSALAGLGPLEALLADPDISEIIVENHRSILIEKNGRTVPVRDLTFPSEVEWRRQAAALCTLSGRPLSVDHPMQTFFLSDGSRVTVVAPPVAHRGTVMNIRRKRAGSFTLEALIARGALSAEVARYLEQAVRSWANILICGESGCGKTSLLEALVNCISPHDRAIIIEENAELNPSHPHLRYLLASPDARQEGISLRDCTRFSMLMSPRRLIVGEAKEGEAADMLFAITSGFSGCMTTIHAYSGA
ncbi:MAG: ATPase, T2SS/T4P/T4SS family, partial [Candidatus Micrarchaeaceae archaeon]